VTNRLVVVGLVLPDDHPLILASHAIPRLRAVAWASVRE